MHHTAEGMTDMCIAGGQIDGLSHGHRLDGMRMTRVQPSGRKVPAHEHVYFEGDIRDCIYVVESGWVKLYRTLIDGQRQVVGFANAGSILGLESEAEHINGCEAVTEVFVRAIPVARIKDVCRTDADFGEQLLRQLGRQLGAAQAQLAAVGVQSAEQKLATFLLSISDLCEASGNGEFDLPMRRGDMAEFLGLRLETISRKMTDFQRRGWIRMTSLYRCRILRRHVLEDLAEGGQTEDAHLLHAC
jgi:CRP/FNR family transcriptional regulator, anaerobic regulatory protein